MIQRLEIPREGHWMAARGDMLEGVWVAQGTEATWVMCVAQPRNEGMLDIGQHGLLGWTEQQQCRCGEEEKESF